MDANEQIRHFGDEIDKLVDRFRDEYELPYASIVGVLNMKAFLLCRESEKDEEETE